MTDHAAVVKLTKAQRDLLNRVEASEGLAPLVRVADENPRVWQPLVDAGLARVHTAASDASKWPLLPVPSRWV